VRVLVANAPAAGFGILAWIVQNSCYGTLKSAFNTFEKGQKTALLKAFRSIAEHIALIDKLYLTARKPRVLGLDGGGMNRDRSTYCLNRV
jgi:hypothetical protein